jgi:hypothetical protein
VDPVPAYAELRNLYASPKIIRVNTSMRMRLAGHVAHMGEKVYKILVGRLEWKRQLRRPRRRWEHNIRMDRREVGREGVGWIHLAEDWIQWWDIVNLRVP